MKVQKKFELAPYTSFGVGGPAELLIVIESNEDILPALAKAEREPLWLLGHGTNVLISDEGLPGTTLRFAGGKIDLQDTTLIAEAGAEWDELVKTAIAKNLWGIELTSGVPGSVGAAAYINIAAYGQMQSDVVEWIEVIDKSSRQPIRLGADKLRWDYKQSIFQYNDDYIISRVAYKLSLAPTTELTYQAALDVASELKLKPDSLEDRRKIIMEARQRAGSLFEYGGSYAHTVGSFFRNPLVTAEQAEFVMEFDESGRTKDQLKNMSQVHGGNTLRVSAAHVMLAAGFKRGQSWGPVRLHPQNLLKLENTGGATAQNIYDVAQEVLRTVKDKLDITLEPEAKILGNFSTAEENL